METTSRFHNKLSQALLALTVAWMICAALLPDDAWPLGVLVVLAAVSTLVSLVRSLQFQNVCVAAAMILFIASAVIFLNAKTSIPFGPFVFTDHCGERLFDVLPLAPPLLWLVVILNCRGVARLILRPWRKMRTYGFRAIGLTCLLAALFDFGLEPFATRAHRFWLWQLTAGNFNWFGTPWISFLGWFVTALLILAFVTPWLINKMPGGRRPPDYQPLILWLTLNLFLAASLATHELWLPAGLLLAVSAAATVAVWRNK